MTVLVTSMTLLATDSSRSLAMYMGCHQYKFVNDSILVICRVEITNKSDVTE